MESWLCESPVLLEKLGTRVLACFEALLQHLDRDSDLLRDVTRLKTIYECRFYAALDYHGFGDMHAHDLCCRRADALLLAESTRLPAPLLQPLRVALAQASFCSALRSQ